MNLAKPWASIELPAEILAIPGMLSHEEKQYLIWLTSQVYEGWGAIVDLGCWLGCSSACLAEGLKRVRGAKCVQSCDLFVWETSYMDECHQANLPQGADFQPLFNRFTAPYGNWIRAQKMDLMHHRWEGGPVELLFIDAAKNWELMNAIFQSYGSSILAGKTRIIFQDFRFWATPWLPLITDSRRDLWREMESVTSGWTVTFVALKDVLGPEGLALPYSASSFCLERDAKIFENRMNAEKGEARELFRQGLNQLATFLNPTHS